MAQPVQIKEAVTKDVTPPLPKTKAGKSAEIQPGVDLCDRVLNVFDCGPFGKVELTSAEKKVLDEVGQGNPKAASYLSVYTGGNNAASSIGQWFTNNIRRVKYMKYLKSKQVYDMKANIAPYVRRITEVIHATPAEMVDYLSGIKNIYDIPPHILQGLKVRFTYDAKGEPKSAIAEPYTLNEIMNMLKDLEEIDPILGKQFKTKLAETSPILNRSATRVDRKVQEIISK